MVDGPALQMTERNAPRVVFYGLIEASEMSELQRLNSRESTRWEPADDPR